MDDSGDYNPVLDEIELGLTGQARYFSPSGEPCTIRQYWAYREDPGQFRVGHDELRWSRGRGLRVSTVYLGANHQWGPGLPLIFETMVFAAGTFHDEDTERYPTRETAEIGHEAIVTALTRELVDAGHTVVRSSQTTSTLQWSRTGRNNLRRAAASLGEPLSEEYAASLAPSGLPRSAPGRPAE